MRIKVVAWVLFLLAASLAPSLEADCPPNTPLDFSVWCQAHCKSTGWCEWSLAHQPSDSCFSGTDNNCTQLQSPHCQCTTGSLALF
jgi:hypothetical protein